MFARLAGRVPSGHLWYLLKRMSNEKPHRFGGQTHINTFFPPYPSQAFDRFCRAIVERKRRPLSVYLAVTGRCPFRCGHCSYGGRDDEQMPRETMLKLIEQIKQLGTCTLGLTGGEPMLREDLEELIAAAGPEMATVVFTTGYGLDAARAKKLFAAGVTCVTVGLESCEGETHDAVRGVAGSFEAGLAAIRACREAGVYTAISTIGTREKIHSGELARMYELGKELGVGEFRMLAPVATGALAKCPSAMLSPEERRYLFDFHIRHNRKPDGPAIAGFAYLESDELFGCGAGYHHLFIDASGNVCPCDLTPLSFGNVKETSLAKIWERMNEFFPLPRRGCLMGTIAKTEKFQQQTELPLSYEVSRSICPKRDAAKPLPEGYRRLVK